MTGLPRTARATGGFAIAPAWPPWFEIYELPIRRSLPNLMIASEYANLNGTFVRLVIRSPILTGVGSSCVGVTTSVCATSTNSTPLTVIGSDSLIEPLMGNFSGFSTLGGVDFDDSSREHPSNNAATESRARLASFIMREV